MAEAWQTLARRLADGLRVDNGLDPEWRESFAAIPRHQFVPEFVEPETDAWIVGPERPDLWFTYVYADTGLITQVRPSAADGTGAKRSTSSSSMPHIMAWMLQATELRPGQAVLEIGTGTGYNAALLAQRLGSDQVTTVDIDPDLIALAEKRLHAIGLQPTLMAGDGTAGYPENGPYDVIISTAAVDHVPPAWIEQLKPEGRIVTDLRGEFAGAMTTFRKTDEETVEGKCHDFDAMFMPMRRDVRYPLRHGPSSPLVVDRRNPQRGTTRMDVQLLDASRALRFLAELQLGATRTDMFTTMDEIVVNAVDESWATATLEADHEGQRAVQQGGPRRMWDSIEVASATWHRAGCPTLGDFGVTATGRKDDQRVWLKSPDSALSWPLPL